MIVDRPRLLAAGSALSLTPPGPPGTVAAVELGNNSGFLLRVAVSPSLVTYLWPWTVGAYPLDAAGRSPLRIEASQPDAAPPAGASAYLTALWAQLGDRLSILYPYSLTAPAIAQTAV